MNNRTWQVSRSWFNQHATGNYTQLHRLTPEGKDAISALQKQAYNVIFMDMQMPEMDGLEATRRIRADFPADRQPIIIAMTANAMDGDKQECLDAGMNDYISKPILPEIIEATLQRWCTADTV